MSLLSLHVSLRSTLFDDLHHQLSLVQVKTLCHTQIGSAAVYTVHIDLHHPLYVHPTQVAIPLADAHVVELLRAVKAYAAVSAWQLHRIRLLNNANRALCFSKHLLVLRLFLKWHHLCAVTAVC